MGPRGGLCRVASEKQGHQLEEHAHQNIGDWAHVEHGRRRGLVKLGVYDKVLFIFWNIGVTFLVLGESHVCLFLWEHIPQGSLF